MADDQSGLGPDDLDTDLDTADVLRSADDAGSADDTWVRSLLADLDFLRPEFPAAAGATAGDAGDAGPSDAAGEPMPPWVWTQIGATLAAEGGGSRRRPAWVRWGGGLVAASVAVLAIGLAVTSFSGGAGQSGSGDSSIMAGAALDTAVMKDSAPAKAAAPAERAAPTLEAAPTLSFAGIVPPTLNLIGSRTDYRADDLKDQVTSLLQQLDMAPEKARAAMQQLPGELVVPDAEPPDMLTTPVKLRACVTKLTKIATSTALLIDWSTFHGVEAGVIIAPEYPTPGEADVTELDIWVVDHRCEVQEDDHLSMR